VDLGLMSLFGRACIGALRVVPVVNAQIEGGDIVYHRRVHLGIAVSTERGLVVPVIRDADSLGLPDLERRIEELAQAVFPKNALNDVKNIGALRHNSRAKIARPLG
jgi:2-oxoglutarate dehydrogenase E2 component (dihydrolipoamide succinyltransferase)